MLVRHSSQAKAHAVAEPIRVLLNSVSAARLRRTVETLAFPRHYWAEAQQNRFAAEMIASELAGYGYNTQLVGQYQNVLALPSHQEPLVLIGAHFDSVPGTPGADDNASAVAALLECARLLQAQALPVCFVAFNAEEDGLLGSEEFVKAWLPASNIRIRQAHILEMVGYCQHTPGSQRLPPGLPIRIPDQGNFIGVLGNKHSNAIVNEILGQGKTYLPEFPVLGLQVQLGIEKLLPVLGRSDHAPFWRAGIPAVMWTDTAEFRNPNYHLATDTPATLDYEFLGNVTSLLLATILSAFTNDDGRTTNNIDPN
jgi:hypothetical protein